MLKHFNLFTAILCGFVSGMDIVRGWYIWAAVTGALSVMNFLAYFDGRDNDA